METPWDKVPAISMRFSIAMQLLPESLSSIKQKAINHLLDLNPYNIKKDYLNKNISYKDLAISRYEKYLKSRKLNKN